MEYKELDILTLDDDKEYVIADILEYEGKKYAYLAGIGDNKSFMYAELKSNDLITAIGSEHIELIEALNKIIANDIDKIKNIIISLNN